MLPAWFGCKNCLFFKEGSNICVYLPTPVEKFGEAYCAHWTCRRCWQRWDEVETRELMIDHNRCKPKVGIAEL